MMMAPGAGAARVSAPAHPGLDETLVEPEGRAEVIRGRRVEVAPALPEHGDPHFRLDVALGTHLAPGYTGSTDMLTRTSEESNFATDTSVRREGIDPATGQRYLEELAFEVVNTQRPGDVTEKAEELTARGVRRVFAVFARRGVVSEWRGGQWVAHRRGRRHRGSLPRRAVARCGPAARGITQRRRGAGPPRAR